MRLAAQDIGQRVVVRYRIPDGRATDVLGELLAVTDTQLTVRDRAGLEHVVDLGAVVAAKVVPPARVWPDRPEPDPDRPEPDPDRPEPGAAGDA